MIKSEEKLNAEVNDLLDRAFGLATKAALLVSTRDPERANVIQDKGKELAALKK